LTLPRIGVFDSGVGGLTVLKAMAEQLPAHYLYFGDTARLPYGTKSAETVARYAIGAARFLEAQNIDLLVIACNTATALAFPAIREATRVPVVGVVDPGAAAAAKVSKNGAAIVIGTEATVSSHAYRSALERHGLEAYEMACPLFVPLVEEGWTDHVVTEQVARIYLDDAMAKAPMGADVLVLACTHYPLIAPMLRRILPEQIAMVDSAESTAAVVRRMVEEMGERLAEAAAGEGNLLHWPERIEDAGASELSRRTAIAPGFPQPHRTFRFYVTDSTEKFKRLATRFLGRQVDNVEHVDLGG
jgi:glutamate racemase